MHLGNSRQTHTHTCTKSCIYCSQNWLHGPIQRVSQQEVTRLVVSLAAGTSAYSTSAWPPQCIGVLIYGLARPMRWGRWSTALSDSIRISVLDAWPQDSPPLRLVTFRWLACEHNQCQTLVSALASKRKITQVFTLPSGGWFTSMARLANKQKL